MLKTYQCYIPTSQVLINIGKNPIQEAEKMVLNNPQNLLSPND